ncbi:MAG: YbjN domain-containing protein [Promicromonosporaceae bacterium]|nr:YbjN domain-containing protein [Promicromonosporaceae bacterium]
MIFRHDDSIEHPSAPSAPGVDVPIPVTMERIGTQLREHGYQFSTDDDGDLTGVWDDNQFWFILGGSANEVLQIRARWQKTIPADKHLDALLIVNDWNRDHLWPKAYFREEGDLVVYAEVSIDLEYGVTDTQLQDILACGLITAVQFFSEIDVPTD